jgi:predicted ATPase
VKDKVNVITAGPSAGKSSTIRELSSRGYRTLPEAARILFDQAISEGRDPEQVREDDDFHEQVENIDRRIERHLPRGEDEYAPHATFLDRSLVDNVAYRRRFGNTDRGDATLRLLQEASGRYDNVFLLERLPMKEDEVRVEDEEEAQKTHEAIRQAYKDLNLDPTEVPLMPVDERADFIESHITGSEPIH